MILLFFFHIAILFPKIFYPMIIGPSIKEDRDRSPPSEPSFLSNKLILFSFHLVHIDLMKQERPNFIRDVIHPGMKERGRAITPPQSVPIVEHKLPPHLINPKTIERRVIN